MIGNVIRSTRAATFEQCEPQRLVLATRVLAASILGCVAISWKLWLNRPYYPFVSVAGLVPAFPSPWDVVALAAWCGVVAGVLWRPTSNLLVGIATAGMVLFLLQDQSRLWPSFYQFCLMLLLRSGYRMNTDDDAAEASRVLMGMRLVVAATYFWGGIQKLTPHFFNEAFPWFIEPLTSLLPVASGWIPWLGAAVAILEACIGLSLLTPRFRSPALVAAIVMHGVIAFCIGPLRGHWNDAAWAWSLTAAVQAMVLYWHAPSFSFRQLFSGPPAVMARPLVVGFLVGVLPVLNNLNCWDSALSFNVYSGNVSRAEIWIEPQGVAALPPSLARLLEARDPYPVLDLDRWSRSEFLANQYPENRIFKAVFRRVCQMVPPGTATLYVIEKASWRSPKRVIRYDCPTSSP